MELRLLRYFLAIVEAGSLRTAASRLHLSQPSLTAAMARLEADLGVELLTRGPHGSEPTPAGRYLVYAAHRLLADSDEARRTLDQFATGARGTLSIASVPALLWHRLPTVLRNFGATTDIDVGLVEAAPWTALDLLAARTVDVAALLIADLDAFTHRHRSAFRVLDTGDVPLVLAVPEDAHAGPWRSVEDIGERTLLVPRRAAAVASLPEVVDRYIGANSGATLRVRTVETIQTALALVAAGLGVSIVPDADGQSLARFEVAVHALAPAPPPLRAVYVVRADAPAPTLARFLETTRP
jgi:DNA-binding transcriptional LysR family regulator